jgi:hypothetical protein
MHLIGLAALQGCDTGIAVHHLVHEHNFAHLRFAEPIRDMLAAMLCLSREQLDRQLEDPAWSDRPLRDVGASPRELLHALGGAWGRSLIHPNLWITLLQHRLDFIAEALPHEYDGIVISDVLFDNEADFIRRRGSLIHVCRADRRSAAHGSVPRQKHDAVLISGGRHDLGRQLDQLLRAHGKPDAPQAPRAPYRECSIAM